MSRAFRLATAVIVAAVASNFASNARAQDSSTESLRRFSIREQPLSQALLDFSRQADIIVTVPSTLVRGKVAPRIQGELTPTAALLELLEGSGLQAVYTASGAITIGQPAVQGRAASPRAGTAPSSRPADTRGLDEAATMERNILEEVLVTAQKRTENIQHVPSSVSVLGSQRLQRLHATTITDYAAYIPGLNVSSGGSPGQTTITMRGIAPVGPGAVVGFYVGDTPLGPSSNYSSAREYGLDLMPYDVERIEVLRGPQGTLYGAGAMGGLLKYVLRQPKLSEFEASVGADTSSIAAADDLSWGVRAGINVPLIADRLGLWASYFRQDTAGYIDNVFTGWRDENGAIQQGGRAALLWQINSDATLQLGGLWQQIDSEGDATTSLPITGLDPPTGVATRGDFDSFHPLREPFKKDIDHYAATLDWDLGAANFVSATGYSDTNTFRVEDASFIFGLFYPEASDGEVAEGFAPLQFDLDLQKWTQEFRLTSATGGSIEWMIGAFYTREDSKYLQDVIALDVERRPIARFLPTFISNAFASKYQEAAGFGSATVKLTERFDISAGVRWARNEQEFHQVSTGEPIVIGPAVDVPGASKESVFTYMVSPRLHLDANTMLYARVATGYRPGGPNPRILNVPPTVDADTLSNYEIGIKSEFLGHRALLNLAAFYIDWSDIQQSVTFGGFAGIDNAGDAVSQGVELESSYSPANNLRVSLGAAYTDATMRSSPAELGIKSGAPLNNVPKWTAAAMVDYEFDLADTWTARAGAGYRYVGEQHAATITVENNISYVRPSYRALDLYAEMMRGSWTVRVFAKNATDERGYVGGGASINGRNIPYAIEVQTLQPRTVGIGVDMSF